jgi:hypothetical protein
MCWLCGVDGNVNACSACVYLGSSPQPTRELPEWYNRTFNASFFLPETSYLTKIWFLDKACFVKHVETKKNVEHRSRAGMAIGREMWDRTKKRMMQGGTLRRMQSLNKMNSIPVAIVRIIRFRKLLDILGTAPWAPIKFHENEQILRMLTASHLRLIVGKPEWAEFKTQLYPLVENTRDLSSVENVVWVTNRQQGKTTNLAKFNAALIMLSPVGGNLKYVYSTGLDRSQELCRDSKKYINWIQRDEEVQERIAALGMTIPRIVTNNEKMFILECTIKPGIMNTLKARPMNADGCRGDNPHSADFDEVGFIDEKFWFMFAFPLLQVGGRVFTMATTPPKVNSFFDIFAKTIKKRNEKNDILFLLINHSMTCSRCLEKDETSKCSHKLYLVPKWKVISKFVAMRKLVPAKQQKDFEAEIFGVMDGESPTYFPTPLTNYVFIEKPTIRAPRFGANPVVYISVDPASHDVSYMGMSAIAYTTDGQVVILGMAEVSVAKCQIIQVTMCVHQFTSKVLNHMALKRYKPSNIHVIPIVECNGNEPVARDIVVTVRTASTGMGFQYKMPFTKKYFATAISDDLGVWATNSTKASGVQMLYFMMFDNRIHIVEPLVVVGEVFKKGYQPPNPMSVRELIRDELVQFHDEGKTITGKTANTNDDMAISLIQAVNWSQMVRATAMLENLDLMSR